MEKIEKPPLTATTVRQTGGNNLHEGSRVNNVLSMLAVRHFRVKMRGFLEKPGICNIKLVRYWEAGSEFSHSPNHFRVADYFRGLVTSGSDLLLP